GPVWNAKRQTFADKILSRVVVRVGPPRVRRPQVRPPRVGLPRKGGSAAIRRGTPLSRALQFLIQSSRYSDASDRPVHITSTDRSPGPEGPGSLAGLNNAHRPSLMSLPACSYFVGLRAHHGHQPVELQVGLRRRVVAAGEQGEQDDDDDGGDDRLDDRRDVRALEL